MSETTMTDELPSHETRERIKKRLSLINQALQSPVLQRVIGVPLVELHEEKGSADGGEYVEFSLPLYPIRAIRDIEPSFRDFLEYRLPNAAILQAAKDAASSLISFMSIGDDGKLVKREWDKKPSWWRE